MNDYVRGAFEALSWVQSVTKGLTVFFTSATVLIVV